MNVSVKLVPFLLFAFTHLFTVTDSCCLTGLATILHVAPRHELMQFLLPCFTAAVYEPEWQKVVDGGTCSGYVPTRVFALLLY